MLERYPSTLDANLISGRLYQGGMPLTGKFLASVGFNVLVLCAKEFQPADSQYDGIEVLRCPLDDVPTLMRSSDLKRVRETAMSLARRLKHGDSVLVTCAMGLNRSGLVVAATLLAVTGKKPGPKAIIDLIRAKRSKLALGNKAFVHHIKTRFALPERA